MRDEELYASGVFASELSDDTDAPLEDTDPEDLDLEDDDLEDDDDDLDKDEASYNPLDDYKTDEWA